MPTNTGKYFSCIYCGAEFIIVKPDDTHTKPNKNKINRNKDSVSNEGLCSPNKKLNTRDVNSHI